MSENTKSAVITICGRPNVGKSTITNALVGEKIAIVSSKPQTTRNRICGIVNRGDTQLVLIDTPGLHKAKSRLDDYMVKVVKESMSDVDCIMMLVEPIANVGIPEMELIGRIRQNGAPAVLVINKMDKVKREELLAVMAAYSAAFEFSDIVPVSAMRGDNMDELLKTMEKYAKLGPHLFPEDMTTDQPDKQVVGEMVREKILYCLQREVPHGVAVEVTKFSERDTGIIDASVTIYCEKMSHKGIIIGKDGAMLKKISTLARQDMEKFMGTKVYLETWVKVRENWRDNANYVKDFGYIDK